jgi:hypothetical protein
VSGSSLAAALQAIGLACRVEPRETLALITPVESHRSLLDDDLRRRVLSLAREHGFTHAAVELAPTERGATLRRD